MILPAAPAPAAPSAPAFTPASAEVPPSARDVAFVQAAHRTNLAEVQGGRIAWTRTADHTVKDVAATVMRDHIHLGAALFGVARRLRIALPGEPTAEQKALNERYRAAGAETFDEYYLLTQLAGHREALRMIDTEIAEGDNEAVKALAAQARPVIERHHLQLRAVAEAKGLAGYAGGGGRG